ncbi:hypothetical protein GLO73106DRAFT_00029260, partial [Gloeocapsa sp. PCC 73106]
SKTEAILNESIVEDDPTKPVGKDDFTELETEATLTKSAIEDDLTELETEAILNESIGIEEQTHLEKPIPLTQVELAKRLNTNSSAIRKKRSAPDFPSWSQNRDPDGIAWKYSSKDNSPKNVMFEPIESED